MTSPRCRAPACPLSPGRLLPLLLCLLLTAAAAPLRAEPVSYVRDIRPILDRKCLACHACYDAPCQLKMETAEGLDRGASKVRIDDITRLRDVAPTRLFFDAETTEQWREKGFVSVTERRLSSLMARMLELGRDSGLEENQRIPESIDISPDREWTCPTLEEFERYAHERPQEGMPLAVTGLDQEEYDKVMAWLDQGAGFDLPPEGLRPGEIAHVAMWEEFLNGESDREKLVARYLYEHYFLGHLYFHADPGGENRFFQLVRSITPPGSPVRPVEAVRPNSDPGGEFYYRLRPVKGTLVHKTHITCAFGPDELARLKELFLGEDWPMGDLPGYSEKEASNPFTTFAAIPERIRHRFMLDHSLFLIRNIIRGPICKGSVSADVVDDHFWVMFQSPETDAFVLDREYARSQYRDMGLPGRRAGNGRWGPSKWHAARLAYHRRRREAYRERGPTSLDWVWDGDGENPRCMLTCYRHHDSASVVQGLQGEVPKTILLFDYPIFERFHYQTVLNFDVFGRTAHKVATRLYTDLLRNEAETNFLRLIPRSERRPMQKSWYRGLGASLKMMLVYERLDEWTETTIPYGEGDPRVEFAGAIRARLGPLAGPPDHLNRCRAKPCADPTADATRRAVEGELQGLVNLAAAQAEYILHLPDVTWIRVIVDGGSGDLAYTLIRNRAHRNIAFVLREKARLEPERDRVSLLRGPIGSYPNFVFAVPWQELPGFASALLGVRNEASFTRVVEGYGVRRMNPEFWDHFHFFHEWMQRNDPLEAGVHDMNRYVNF